MSYFAQPKKEKENKTATFHAAMNNDKSSYDLNLNQDCYTHKIGHILKKHITRC